MAINIPVEVTGNASKGLEDLKARLVSLIQRVKELSKQANASNREIDEGFRRSNISGRELTKTVAKITSGLLLAGGAGVRSLTAVAEKTKLTNVESQKFLIAIENFKKRYEEAAQVILPFINRFLDLTQVAATAQQLNNEKIKNAIALYEKFKNTRTPAEEKWLKISERVLDQLKEEKIEREKSQAAAQRKAEIAAQAARDEARAINEATNALKALRELERESERETARALNDELQTRNEVLNTIQSLERQQAEEEAAAALDAQKEKARELGMEYNFIGSAASNAFQQIINKSNSVDSALSETLRQIASFIVQFAIFKSPQFGAFSQFSGFKHGGVIPRDIPHAQNGMIVRRPTLVATGEGSQPEAIVPLSPNRARDRARVMQDAGLSTGGNITVNLNLPNISFLDPITLRNRIMPEINRQVRRGERLVSSSTL